MTDDDTLDQERQRLFAMVWDRPATEVAEELGISDVRLGKLCRRLQVPKPPRGYWARVGAGKTARKPPLRAFREEIDPGRRGRGKRGSGARRFVPLSKLQREFLGRALGELAASGTDTTGCEVRHDGIRSVSGDLAAQILILVQNRFEAWLKQRSPTPREHAGAFRSMRGLVEKLIPVAREQVVILHRHQDPGCFDDPDEAVIIRLSADLQRRIAHLYRLVRENNLAYVVLDLRGIEHAQSVGYLHSPDSLIHARTKLCVSADGLWGRCSRKTHWVTDQFETVRLQLREVVPVDLLSENAVQLPTVMRDSMLRPYAKRLRALKDVENAFETVSMSAYRTNNAVPGEHLAIVDRLWFGGEAEGPFSRARRALDEIDSDLEAWEQRLALEQTRLVRDVLGVAVGDDVVFESQGQTVRVRLEHTSLHVLDKAVRFYFWGKRYRKDGLPGKRDAYFVLSTENDSD